MLNAGDHEFRQGDVHSSQNASRRNAHCLQETDSGRRGRIHDEEKVWIVDEDSGGWLTGIGIFK